MSEIRKVALVTGGSRGIGKACAIELAKAGCDVVINYAGNADAANKTVEELKALGSNSEAYKFDVSNQEEVNENIAKIIEKYGRIDVLLNNAGITCDDLFIRMDADKWNAVINTNLNSVFYVSKPVVKLPTAEGFGLTEIKIERLSQIIAEINSRMGKTYDNDVAVKAMLQIKDIMLKSDRLRTSAKNNTVKDFEFAYYDGIDDALVEGLTQNQDFFSLLLSNEDIKKQVLGIFTEEIYKSLREA